MNKFWRWVYIAFVLTIAIAMITNEITYTEGILTFILLGVFEIRDILQQLLKGEDK